MNYKNTTLAIAAIVAAVAMTAVALVIPQQVLAYGHHHNNNSNSVNVSQDVTSVNGCSGNGTVCLNDANNSADIHR